MAVKVHELAQTGRVHRQSNDRALRRITFVRGDAVITINLLPKYFRRLIDPSLRHLIDPRMIDCVIVYLLEISVGQIKRLQSHAISL